MAVPHIYNGNHLLTQQHVGAVTSPLHSGEPVDPGSILLASSKALSVTVNNTREVTLNVCVAVRGPWPGVHTMGLGAFAYASRIWP